MASCISEYIFHLLVCQRRWNQCNFSGWFYFLYFIFILFSSLQSNFFFCFSLLQSLCVAFLFITFNTIHSRISSGTSQRIGKRTKISYIINVMWAHLSVLCTQHDTHTKKDDKIKKKKKRKTTIGWKKENNSKFYAHARNEIGIDTKSTRFYTCTFTNLTDKCLVWDIYFIFLYFRFVLFTFHHAAVAVHLFTE